MWHSASIFSIVFENLFMYEITPLTDWLTHQCSAKISGPRKLQLCTYIGTDLCDVRNDKEKATFI